MVGYENAARINASGYQVFGDDLPDPFVSTDGYTHDTATWPGNVYDFSGCPLGITDGENVTSRSTGALITPRHLMCADHYAARSGTVTFVTPAGTKLERTITDFSDGIGSDIIILTLNSAVTGCAFYPLPTAESMPTIGGATIWCLKRQRRIVTRTVLEPSELGTFTNHVVNSTGLTLEDQDSNQPAFITRGTQLVLLGTHFGAGQFDRITSDILSDITAYCAETSQTISTVSIDPASWVEPLAAPL